MREDDSDLKPVTPHRPRDDALTVRLTVPSVGSVIELHFIDPGKPIQNGHIESFNGRFKDECLNRDWFIGLRESRSIIEQWRMDYNTMRPHSSLGYLPPEVWARKQKLFSL
jgi:putative transposase